MSMSKEEWNAIKATKTEKAEKKRQQDYLASPVSHLELIQTAMKFAGFEKRLDMHERILGYLKDSGAIDWDKYQAWCAQKQAEAEAAAKLLMWPDKGVE